MLISLTLTLEPVAGNKPLPSELLDYMNSRRNRDLDFIALLLFDRPKEWVVADMGCGEATLAERVPQSRVHSLDLVAANARVTACDMAHTPLAAASVDVVVFCLSLMGTNLNDFLIEANRILREG